MTVSARRDIGDDLTEFISDLSEYTDARDAVYAAVQAIAEGRAATLEITASRVDEFVGHMREFGVDTEVAPA